MQNSWQLIALFTALAGCTGSSEDRESFGGKSEWSILQGVEYDTRGSAVASPVERTIGQYKLVGLPSMDGKRTIWVMLNPQHPPLYKQMPDGGYRISRTHLDSITHARSATPEVLAVLASHVAE